MKPQEVLSFIANQGIKIVDMRFSDLFGTWQHFSVSAKEFSESVFEKGLGFDGSSLRAFKERHDCSAGPYNRVFRPVHAIADTRADLPY